VSILVPRRARRGRPLERCTSETGLAPSDIRRSWRTSRNKGEHMTGPEHYLRAEELLSGLSATHPDPETIATA